MDVTEYCDLITNQIESDWELESEIVHPYDDAPYAQPALLAWPHEIAQSILETRIQQLCRNCEGSGGRCECSPFGLANHVADCGTWKHCKHSDAPTIADLLRVGAEAWDHRDYLWVLENNE